MIILDHNLAFLIFTAGALSIIYEILFPGLLFPGFLGLIAVLFGIMQLQHYPVQNPFLVLMILGLVVIVTEAFFFTKGFLATTGLLFYLFGVYKLFSPEFKTLIPHIATAGVASLLLILFIILKKPYMRNKPTDLIGKTGIAMHAFQEEGLILVENKILKAKCNTTVYRGESIKIINIDNGNTEIQLTSFL